MYVARRAGAAGFQRLFAIKLMHEHLADHEEFVQMFLDEARIAARLHHPNVVAIVDVGEIDGRQFVVMDYIEGCSLGQLFKLSPEQRPIKAIASIFTDFLTGLHAAHELRDDDGNMLNLVHRDVSPQNILVGLDGVARITDFGIAKAEARLTSTRPGLRKGKLAFMAPEQLYDKTIDRRADVFAAGALLWTSLTGEKLFSGSSDAATMRNLLQMEIRPPSTVGLKPPPAFDDVCLKALERDADDRYQTAAELVEALRAAAIEHGVFGTAGDAATWVRQFAGGKIDDRRKALGKAVSGESSIRSIPVLVESPSAAHSGISSMSRASVMPMTRPRRRTSTLLALSLIPAAALLAALLAVLTHPSEDEDAVKGRSGTVMPEEAPGPAATAPVDTVTAAQAEIPAAPPLGEAPEDQGGVPSIADPLDVNPQQIEEPRVVRRSRTAQRRTAVLRARAAAAARRLERAEADEADTPDPEVNERDAVSSAPPPRAPPRPPEPVEEVMERNPYLRGAR